MLTLSANWAVMIAIVVLLTLVHKRLRLRRLREIREYYEEQVTYVIRTGHADCSRSNPCQFAQGSCLATFCGCRSAREGKVV
ncbi:hypothetical protein BD310DRAFT_928698 [Dichomitus squalens]|uniref:Uncharacterized protein n=1 Tax=Dichomitus squalens TaxID=114155 RepID=A0A4Q9PTV0_9APHY|nr:hypothetical protein BD310DRAFT_928698 [Dichomitus squalens]